MDSIPLITLSFYGVCRRLYGSQIISYSIVSISKIQAHSDRVQMNRSHLQSQMMATYSTAFFISALDLAMKWTLNLCSSLKKLLSYG